MNEKESFFWDNFEAIMIVVFVLIVAGLITWAVTW
jgi:hypothetical protein